MEKLIQKDKPLYPEIIWKRPVHFYKSQAGKIFVLAGSARMTGAAILTSEAIFRSGTGILVLGFPEGLKSVYKKIMPEAMTLPLPETPGYTLSQKAKEIILEQIETFDAAVIGPGLSLNSETIHLIWELLFEIEIPLVIDADALSAFSKGLEVMRSKESIDFMKDYLKKSKSRFILTPHPGEAARILKAINHDKYAKINASYIEGHKEEIASFMADELNSIVVLKGHDTVIAEPQGRLVTNKVGGPELATAGSGDVLSGIIGSFVGQNPNKIFESVVTAVYLHGEAGKLAKDKLGERSVMASDIIRYLPEAIKETENNL